VVRIRTTVKPKTTAEATARLWLGLGLGREADFSAALLAKYASNFGRNDDFLDWEKRTDNGNRNRGSFDYSTHDNAVSAFAPDDKSTFDLSVLGSC
jgi:hypothetical protein